MRRNIEYNNIMPLATELEFGQIVALIAIKD